jgi:lipid A ethanolaminephosphotransferase
MKDQIIQPRNYWFKLKSWQLHFIASLVLLCIFNSAFWAEINKIIAPNNLADYLFMASVFILLFTIINLIINLLCNRYSYRILYPIIFFGSALSLYFIKQYSIIIDRDMIQNIVETNPAEATDFINLTMLIYVIMLGIVPTVLVFKSAISFRPFKYALLLKFKIFALSLISMVILLYISYPSYASMARGNRHLSHLIIPTNFIFAGVSYLKQQVKSAHKPLALISKDVKLNDFWQEPHKKTVLVLVIGETARADHFGIYGYEKQTTPKLAKRDLIKFKQVSSCGTSTAISLPCMFSHLDRENFSKDVAKNSENLLDFLANSGFSVQWRDNNTGCKGICKRVEFLDLTDVKDNPHCTTGECFDEILLEDMAQQIKENPNNQVIVLHQKGSHGPAYYLRYPQSFNKFTPICATNELQDCSETELMNTYDNTILYTDFIVDKVIGMLDGLPAEYNSSLIYLSDHGESLGENNIFLHGTPYFMAPVSQTHVPLMLWLSESFKQNFGIDLTCLKYKQDLKLSHDNYFHSVLGLLNINTQFYDPNKDIFQTCEV